MLDLFSTLQPRYVEIKGARKVLFGTLVDAETTPRMTPLQEAEHDYKVYERRLAKAVATGVCGEALGLLKRQRDYKRRLYFKLAGVKK